MPQHSSASRVPQWVMVLVFYSPILVTLAMLAGVAWWLLS